MKNQLYEVEKHLIENGFITRNYCLQNFLSRLASRIDDLKKQGWEFKTERIKYNGGTDFKYTAIRSPYEKEEFIHPITGEKIIRWKKKYN